MAAFEWRKWFVAASIAGLVLSAQGVAGADDPVTPATFKPQPGHTPGLTKAVRITKDEPVPTRAFTGPYMLADPSNPRVIVAATAELRTRVCYLGRSTDAGATWHILPALPAPGSYPFCSTPYGGITMSPLAWGRNHTLYYALVGYNNSDGGDSRGANFSILLARSTDLGNTWAATIVDNNRGLTGAAVTNDSVASVAVDTSGPKDAVYVGWRNSHPNVTKGPGSVSQTMVARSSDGGVTFAKPVDINGFSHVTVSVNGTDYPLIMGAPILAADSHGVVEAISGPGTPSRNTIPGATPPEPLLGARSTDQGRTWTVSAIAAPASATRSPVVSWSPQGGAQGTFLTAFQASPGQQAGESDILFQRSTDGGRTWTSAVKLNDDSVAQDTHFLPQLNVAPNGRADVIWYDFRLQHGFSPDVYYTHSSDSGVTWAPNQRVTDRSINFALGVSGNSDLRQPPGVASANQYTAFGWTDTRLANDATQTQDDFGNVAQFSPLPASGSNTVPILAAIFGGLAAAGVILVLLLLRRRRKDPMPPVPRDRQHVGAG